MHLSSDAIQSHFPAMGHSFKIETDGEWLIIRHIPMSREWYDIRIRRKDAKGDIIAIRPENEFPKTLIYQVAQAAIEMYKGMDPNDYSSRRFLCSNIGSGNYSCNYTNLKNKKEGPLLDPDWKSVRENLEKIHRTFFEPSSYLVYEGDGQMIKPSLVTRDAWPEYRSNDPVEDGDNDHWTDYYFENHFREKNISKESSTSTPLVTNAETESSTSAPSVTNAETEASSQTKSLKKQPEKEGEEEEKAIGKRLEQVKPETVQGMPKKSYLNGLTYPGLQDYAKGLTSDPRYKEPYQSFLSLLKDPDSKGDQEMFAWLQELYLKEFDENQKFKNLYVEELRTRQDRTQQYLFKSSRSEDEDFQRWCKVHAAARVTGFIRQPKPNIEIQALAKAIIESCIIE